MAIEGSMEKPWTLHQFLLSAINQAVDEAFETTVLLAP